MTNFVSNESPLDMFYHWENKKPDAIYLRQPVAQAWHDFTWREVGQQARQIAAALQAMTLEPGDRVSILSGNCAHWIMADLAVMMSGYSSAPIFTSMTGDDARYILDHSGSRILFVGQAENWARVREMLPANVIVIALPFADVPGADFFWNDLLSDYEPLAGNPNRKATDELTTIYTSGSTGRPKGVMYSFEGAGHIVRNIGQTFNMVAEDRLISYLPLAHGFERGVIDFMSMYAGCTIGFNESQLTFAADMQTIRPTFFQCVPRLWRKFQDAVLAGVGGQESLEKLLADPSTAGETRAQIKQNLGLDAGRILLTGSAPTPVSLHAWYESLDMPLCEIYGQSEVLSGTSNLPWDRKAGTLGKPMANTEIEIAGDGEILIRAKAVMLGYLHEPDKTAATLINGWVHTGDRGELDEEGFLTITGRVKEIFKTAKGKYVAPLPVESKFSTSPYLEQMCLMGSGLPQTVLLVQLSEVGKNTERPLLEKTVYDQTLRVNAELDSHQRIACVIISASDWNTENGLATHTMKIKRAALESRYGPLAEKVFLGDASVVSPLIAYENSFM
ncbi:AMP-dependent synthetase [Kineobactrum sediminis]|uniref:AMP-dependent synthetase n=1 Tax=Kineobactrum sediminis TaxID=1905677 RepID=A0A2N5XZ83_9GAMM|nr:AMP-binding protein [Kineobactrum sediminis]PLW81450.1 AMP-dependent synthetase [Kineobactrum sediminis]